MLGFTSESADEQRRLETLFDEQMNRDNLREWMERITAEPFFVGTPHNKENAEWVADLFRDWGYDTEIVVAHEHGALATILYSDPRDDGYFRGDVYPDGPFRMAQGVQRGSVTDMPLYPGDPLTPFVGATADADRMTAVKRQPSRTVG